MFMKDKLENIYNTNLHFQTIIDKYNLMSYTNLYTNLWEITTIVSKFKKRKSINYHYTSYTISAYLNILHENLLLAMVLNDFQYELDTVGNYYFNVSSTSINQLINGNKRNKLEKYAINDLSREQDLDYLMQLFDNKCAYCRIPLTKQLNQPNSVELDHIKSLSEQYNNSDEYDLLIGRTFDNTVPSCKRCNREKSSSDLKTWLNKKFHNSEEIMEHIEFILSQQQEFLFS